MSTIITRKDLNTLRKMMGQVVTIDVTKVENMKAHPHYDEDNIPPPFDTTVVGLNKFNCGNNGTGNNDGGLIVYPSVTGANWGRYDPRMVTKIHGVDKDMISDA